MNDGPYVLPEGNVLVSLSGGRTSGYMLHQILEANGSLPDRCKVVFANTGREMPETLDFVQECGARWGVPITWVEYTRKGGKVGFQTVSHNSAARDGEPFEVLIRSKKYLPNIVARFCTQELKVLTIKRYLVANEWDRWTQAIGIRADEDRRIRAASTKDRWANWYPIYEAGHTKADVMEFWRGQPFDLRLYGPRGVTPKGNCDGCFLKSEATLAMMYREHPERMEWWERMEAATGSTFHKARSFAELGNFVRTQADWIFNDEAHLCQRDDGECTT